MSGKRGQLGTSSNLETSPGRKKRQAQLRKRQDARWARKAGPLRIYYVCPICGWDHARADCPESDT